MFDDDVLGGWLVGKKYSLRLLEEYIWAKNYTMVLDG